MDFLKISTNLSNKTNKYSKKIYWSHRRKVKDLQWMTSLLNGESRCFCSRQVLKVGRLSHIRPHVTQLQPIRVQFPKSQKSHHGSISHRNFKISYPYWIHKTAYLNLIQVQLNQFSPFRFNKMKDQLSRFNRNPVCVYVG